MSLIDFNNPPDSLVTKIVNHYLKHHAIENADPTSHTDAVKGAMHNYFNVYLNNKYSLQDQKNYLIERHHINLANKNKLIQLVKEGVTLKKLDDIL